MIKEVQQGGIGIARYQTSDGIYTSDIGTPAYMPIEQYDSRYSENVDVFSFGVVLYELVFGTRAFTGNTNAILWRLLKGDRPNLDSNMCENARGAHDVTIELIRKCWSSEASERPTFCGIHDQLSSIDFKLLTIR